MSQLQEITNSGAAREVSLAASSARYGERLIRVLLFLAASISVLTTIGIVTALIGQTVDFFGVVNFWDFITGTKWTPSFADPEFGVLPLVGGTLLITAIALVIAVPIGLGAAIYLSEYASPRTRKVLKPVLELLAGVPTIVYGYFALTFLTPVILNDILGLEVPVFNALSAGIVMAVMVLPTIASVAEDAMSAVPQGLREAAYGLGSSRRQVSTRVIFPASLSGIVAAIVLGSSRAIGETVIALVAAGLIANLTIDPREPALTMAAFIADMGRGDTPVGSIEYKTIFAVGATLFLMTLVMNLVSNHFVRKFHQEYE